MPKKVDFAGKPITSKTYTKDWVFVKNQHPTGPNVSHGAWMTTRQARDLHEQELKDRAARLASNQTGNIPMPGQPATTVPVNLAGGATAPVPATTAPSEAGITPPAWWIPTAYSNPNEQQSFANAANAVMPTLSPEDQRTMANYLATNFGDVFGAYANASFSPIPTQLTNERTQYLNPARAQAAMTLLNKVKEAAGGTPGAGYTFLNNALNLMNQYSNQGSPMTREQFTQFQTGLKSLIESTGKDLSAYGNLAQMFNLPSFSAGQLVSNAPIPRLNQ